MYIMYNVNVTVCTVIVDNYVYNVNVNVTVCTDIVIICIHAVSASSTVHISFNLVKRIMT